MFVTLDFDEGGRHKVVEIDDNVYNFLTFIADELDDTNILDFKVLDKEPKIERFIKEE